jgi:hypothetical protein
MPLASGEDDGLPRQCELAWISQKSDVSLRTEPYWSRLRGRCVYSSWWVPSLVTKAHVRARAEARARVSIGVREELGALSGQQAGCASHRPAYRRSRRSRQETSAQPPAANSGVIGVLDDLGCHRRSRPMSLSSK